MAVSEAELAMFLSEGVSERQVAGGVRLPERAHLAASILKDEGIEVWFEGKFD